MAQQTLPRRAAPGIAGIGERIWRLRSEQGLTVADVADLLGVGKSIVSKWERAEAIPNAAFVMPLCEIFNSTPEWLLDGHGNQYR